MTRKDWRRFGSDGRADLLQRAGTFPANVTLLPRRLRRFATWADLLASYEAPPVGPAEVLAFAPPPPTTCRKHGEGQA